MKTALVTGITGQGGAYLAEFLLKKDMIHSDLKLMRKEQFLKNNGFEILNYFE